MLQMTRNGFFWKLCPPFLHDWTWSKVSVRPASKTLCSGPIFPQPLRCCVRITLCAVSLWKLCMCQLCLSPVLASLGRPACPHYRQRQAEFQKEICLRKFTFFSVRQDKIQRRAKRRKYWSMSWEIRKLEGNITNKLSQDSSVELS